MKWEDYVEENPAVMLGKPVCKGTRITVELIREELGRGSPKTNYCAATLG
jgi:uncharacterized protein (DUF433 family)